MINILYDLAKWLLVYILNLPKVTVYRCSWNDKKEEPFSLPINKKNMDRQTSGSVYSSKNELELHILTSINLKNMLSEKEDSE